MPLPSHACHRDDRDTSNAALGGPDALVKPDTQRTIGLVAEPNPGQFDHDCAGLRIASLADALVATHGTALEVAGRQPNIAPEPLAIVELPVEDFTNQHRGDSRSDALDLDEILNLLDIEVRAFGRDNSFALCFNCLDHCQHQFQALQFAYDLSFEVRRQFAPVAGPQLLQA